MSAGRVGRPHGRDGSFHVERPEHALEPGTRVAVAGRQRRIERRAGTERHPLVRLSGVNDREAAATLLGEPLLVEDQLGEREWLAGDLVGCRAGDLGRVRRVLEAPSCTLLELDHGRLVPFVSDAVRSVDLDAGTIELDEAFLGER